MIGIVFAAGLGTRLKPFTDSHPKALADVGGTAALERVIRRLVDGGARGVVVNAHHFAEQVVDFIAARTFGVPVELSIEDPLLLDTAGGLAQIYRRSTLIAGAADDEPIVVHNADIITDFPLSDIVGSLTGGDAAILVNPERRSSRRFLFDPSLRLRGWENITTGDVRPAALSLDGLTPAAFGGVHAMYKPTLAHISDAVGPDLRPYGITDFYITHCDSLDIRGCVPPQPYRWFDIGTPERLAAASAAMT